MELELQKKGRSHQSSKKKIVEYLQKQLYSKTGMPFPMQLILKVTGYSSSTWYEKPRGRKECKPGPKQAINDTEALKLMKEDLKNSSFNGEDYLKVKKCLAKNNKHIAKHRVNATGNIFDEIPVFFILKRLVGER